MNNKESVYLKTIFTAVPLMSDDEKDRLLRIAEEMERKKNVENDKDRSNSLANLLSILKVLMICVLGTFAFGFCMVFIPGIIEIAVEVLLYLLLLAVLIGTFIGWGLL